MLLLLIVLLVVFGVFGGLAIHPLLWVLLVVALAVFLVDRL